jgi:hypothetical protein
MNGTIAVKSGSKAQARVHEQVKDALELANYVVEVGFKGTEARPVNFADIQIIQKTALALGILDVGHAAPAATAAPPATLTPDGWIAFSQAYYQLASATSPVTVETLRNTREASPAEESVDDRRSWISRQFLDRIFGYSPAQRFSRGLLMFTIAVAAVILILEGRIILLGGDTASKSQLEQDIYKALIPWCYGALGACAFLLRSAHTYIYQRSFDLRRKPEYTNRILLGAVSGGTIILLSGYLNAEDDTFAHLSAAALGFIAGYSSDFLFNTIERIITAIFPRVSVETVPKDPPPPKPALPPGKPATSSTPAATPKPRRNQPPDPDV